MQRLVYFSWNSKEIRSNTNIMINAWFYKIWMNKSLVQTFYGCNWMAYYINGWLLLSHRCADFRYIHNSIYVCVCVYMHDFLRISNKKTQFIWTIFKFIPFWTQICITTYNISTSTRTTFFRRFFLFLNRFHVHMAYGYANFIGYIKK